MDLKRMWIMNQQQFLLFEKHRQKDYRNLCYEHNLQYFDDHKLQMHYLKNMIRFLRKRKTPTDQPFKFERLIYTAVALFKRYYLVNSFMDQQPTQSIICSIYLGLKLNEYSDGVIMHYANDWREKPIFEPDRNHLHVGEEGYTEKQLIFLQKFGFQIGRTALIQPIEALYMILKARKIKQINQIQTQIKIYLDKVYLDPKILFLHQGPKIALAITLLSLKKFQINPKLLSEQIWEIITLNNEYINNLMLQINNIAVYDQKLARDNDKIDQMRKMTKTRFRRPQIRRSPSFIPKHDSIIFQNQ